MTAGIVSPVVPPTIAGGKKAARPNARRALPLPHLVSPTARSTVCGLASIDCNGRVAEAAVITVLGWGPGDRLNIREHGGLVRITSDRHGVFRMTRPGQLRLPATVRHWCKLTPGSRVLLVADRASWSMRTAGTLSSPLSQREFGGGSLPVPPGKPRRLVIGTRAAR